LNLAPLVQDGLVYIDDEDIEITGSGRLLLRSVAMVFDRYLRSGEGDDCYSQAI